MLKEYKFIKFSPARSMARNRACCESCAFSYPPATCGRVRLVASARGAGAIREVMQVDVRERRLSSARPSASHRLKHLFSSQKFRAEVRRGGGLARCACAP